MVCQTDGQYWDVKESYDELMDIINPQMKVMDIEEEDLPCKGTKDCIPYLHGYQNGYQFGYKKAIENLKKDKILNK